MRDPQKPSVDEEGPKGSTTSEQIARSLGSVWQRFSGNRPKSTSVEISPHVVTCVIEEGAPDAAADEDDATPTDSGMSVDSLRFEYDATAAIARATGRRVIAFIPKRDKETEIWTQTFILDRPQPRF